MAQPNIMAQPNVLFGFIHYRPLAVAPDAKVRDGPKADLLPKPWRQAWLYSRERWRDSAPASVGIQ